MSSKFVIFLFLLSSLPVSIYAQKISSREVAELEYDLIPRYELPKQYILDGRTLSYPNESAFRRMDIVFFLSIPITFYLIQNLISLINVANQAMGNYDASIRRDSLGFTSGEWNFILAATFLIPSGVAMYDYVYVRDYPLIPFFARDDFREVRMTFTIYRTKF